MTKILVTYDMFREGFTELESKYEVTFPEGRDFTYEEVLEMIPEYDVLCSMFDFPVNKELIDHAPKLKMVANYAVGYNNIDVAYCLEKGITVANTPDPVTAPTANLALGLMLDVARRNVTYVSKDELLSQSDFVSLNAPYTPETYHIIGEAELKQMKPTAVLINTGRGPLVDEKALVQALKDGTIHGAGLDVFEFGDYPSPELLEMENVVLTPHIGTQTLETRIIMARTVCNNVIGFLEGDRPVSRVLRP